MAQIEAEIVPWFAPASNGFYGHDEQGDLLHASRITKTIGDYLGGNISNEHQIRTRMLSLPV